MTKAARDPAVPADRATPLLRERIRTVYSHLPGAILGDPEAVHDVRVGARRLRVTLSLAAVPPEGGRVLRARRTLKQLTRAAGESRDFDVALAAFDAHGAARTPETAVLRRRLRQAGGRARRRMAEALLDLEVARLRRDLRVVLARGGEGVFALMRRVHEARDVVGAEALSLLEALGGSYEPGPLHRLRTRIRRLRYTAEVADAVRGTATGAPAALKSLQDELGPLHDAQVLSEWLVGQARSSAARGQPAVATQARALAASFDTEARARHGAFLAARPRETLETALRTMGGGSVRPIGGIQPA